MATSQRQYRPRREANRALANAVTRAKRHAERGDWERAFMALRRGIATAQAWLNGTHPKLAGNS
jgi:hypothetical protein